MKTQMIQNELRARLTRQLASILAVCVLGTAAYAHDDRDHDFDFDGHRGRTPDVPAALQVPAGNTLSFRATGVGVQIYVWNAATSAWVFKAPHAVLFRHDDIVGIHFAGPIWESASGSKVGGTKLASAIVDPTAI